MSKIKDADRSDIEFILQKLQERLGITLQLVGNKVKVSTDGYKILLHIEMLDSVSLSNISAIKNHMLSLGADYVVVTPNATKEVMNYMRDAGINIIDLAGKAFIKHNGIFIFSQEKYHKIRRTAKSSSIVFNEAGIKIIFACLSVANLIGLNYRSIAEQSDTSLGSVSRVVDALKSLGYVLEKKNNNRILVRKNELLNRWCIAYAEILRPKLIIGHYTCENSYWWKAVKINEYNAMWSGEVAAAKLTRNLKPEFVTIYTEKFSPKLQLKHKIRTDSKGEILVLKKFWHFEYLNKNQGLAPHLLIYADLITTGDERNDEVAQEIKNKFIEELFSES